MQFCPKRVADPRTQKRHDDDCALLPNNFTASSVRNRGSKTLISNPDVPRHFLTLLELCFDSFSCDVKRLS